MNTTYSVKQLSRLAGITVRTLHFYDKLGLLRPQVRTNSGYRLYGETELLRLQQILFYKELDFPLKDILQILDEPGFDMIAALESHKKTLHLKKTRINTLLRTIDNTITTLKNKTMLNFDELYDGLSRDEAAAYRKEAIEAHGEEVVQKSEDYLRKLTKDELKSLVAKQKELAAKLFSLKHLDPTTNKIQELIHEHYINTRKLWGTHNATDKQAETYKGLGQLYLTDERFTRIEGKTDQAFTLFLSIAMAYYADHRLI